MELDQLKGLLDILMAAAAADGHTDFKETAAIREVLNQLDVDLETRTQLEAHQWAFDPESFRLEASVKALGELSSEERASVVQLLEHVEEADGIIDLEEEDFIRRVALALGATEDEIASLTVEIIESGPPPIPSD